MEESGSQKSEYTQKSEFESGDNIANQSATEAISVTVKETHDGNASSFSTHIVDSEKQEEGKVVCDTVVETGPVVSVSEASAEVAVDPVQDLGDSEVAEVESKVEKNVLLCDDNDEISTVVSDLMSKEEVEPSSAPSVMDSIPKVIEEATLPSSDENIKESSEYADMMSKENGANLSQAADVPGVDAGIGGENCDMSQAPKSIGNQPSIPVTPHTPTSWMGCCGLFDVLKRSN